MKYIKRIAVILLGGAVLVIGIALIVLPGPAFIVIPAGLAILAIEFAWARRCLRSARAVLPKRSQDITSLPGKLSLQSILRSGNFLFRQVRRIFLPKHKLR